MKKTAGRKPIPEEERRTESVRFRVTKTDKEILRLASERAGMSMSDFIKKTVMDGASIIAGGGTPIEVVEYFTSTGEGFASYLKLDGHRKQAAEMVSAIKKLSASLSQETDEDVKQEQEIEDNSET